MTCPSSLQGEALRTRAGTQHALESLQIEKDDHIVEQRRAVQLIVRSSEEK